ncbi:MAG: lactate utilization protein [Chloroflexi bacterium]|nr:lactate utilization protein [Chloroflexota bacterium]
MSSQLGVPKAEFLDSVRRALGRQSASQPDTPYPHLQETLADLERQAQEIWSRVGSNQEELLTRLAETAQLRGWNVHRTTDPEEAIVHISSVTAAHQAQQVVRSTQEVFDLIPVEQALREAGVNVVAVAKDEQNTEQRLRQEIIGSGVGITGVDYAVAETGSVVVVPGPGLSRLVSLVPPVHIAIVRVQDVVESLDDVFLLRRLEYYRNGGDMGSYLNFITGPSRTADIEQTIVVGVHGPKEVHLILLG